MSNANDLARAMAPTLLDKLIAWRDPVKGLERQRARAMMAVSGSYTGASRSRNAFKSWFASSSDADSDLMTDLPVLRNRSRDLLRNHPLAVGAVNKVCTTVVGTGLRLESQIDADVLGLTEQQRNDWQKNVEREFKLHADSKNLDVTRTQGFAELQELAFRSALENGDAFAVLPMVPVTGWPYATRVQLIEGDRVCNKDGQRDSDRKVGGINLDAQGAPVSYDILKRHPGKLGGQKDWTTVSAYGGRTGRRNVIHLFKRLRAGQNRGVPYLAPVIEPLKQLGRYTDAELMAAVVSGMFTVFVKSEAGQSSLLGPDDLTTSTSNGKTRSDYELGNGAIIEGNPGDSIETINPGRPSDSFDPFVQAVLRQIGMALELPYELIIGHFTASYTASRAAILEAWRFFRNRRKWLSDNFCQPIYEAWMDEAVSLGRLDAPGYFDDAMIRKAYQRAQWHGDGPGNLNPLQEAKAVRERTDIGLTSLAQEKTSYDGGDWELTHAQRSKEHRARLDAGLVEPVSADEPEPMTAD